MGKERNKEEHKGMGGKSMGEESLEMDGRDREREGENSNSNVNNNKLTIANGEKCQWFLFVRSDL